MKKSFIMLFGMILTVLSIVMQPIHVVYAFVDEDSLSASIEHDCDHDNDYVEHDIPRNDPNFNINDYIGEIYESPIMEPFSITENTTCEGESQHGVGREQGHSSNFLETGCTNIYKGALLYQYRLSNPFLNE